ncbi:hypothetical protein, partial [Trinickia mobilis]|uniref:hypothetical protein n=1 Tax=Trinickia mobilis TaxID=2816356 RepID=UPI001A8D4CDD
MKLPVLSIGALLASQSFHPDAPTRTEDRLRPSNETDESPGAPAGQVEPDDTARPFFSHAEPGPGDEAVAALNADLPFDEFVRRTAPHSTAWARVRENNAKHAMAQALPMPSQAARPRQQRVKRQERSTSAPNATVRGYTLADWTGLDQPQKVERAMIELLMREKGLAEPAAAARLKHLRQPLTDVLANEANLREAQSQGNHLLRVDRLLKIEMQLREFLAFHREPTHAQVSAQASALFARDSLPPVQVSDIYVYALQESLTSWVDLAKTRMSQRRPLELLAAVLHRHGQTLPADFYDGAALKDPWHLRLIDEASLLYNQMYHGDMLAGIDGGSDGKMHLCEQFLRAVSSDRAEQKRLDALLASAGNRADIHFDGFAVRNAFNLNFDDLAKRASLYRAPALAELSATQRAALLKEKFAAVGESEQYRIGTPQHSLASTVIRVLEHQGQPVPKRFDSDRALLEQFQKIEKDWAEKRHYPIHPRLLFALHLAHSRGAEIAGKDWKARAWAKPDLPEAKKLLQRHLPEVAIPTDPEERQELLLGWFKDKKMRFKDIALGTSTTRSANLAAQADKWTVIFAGHEVIEGEDWRAKTRALLRYAGEALRASYGSPPRFDRRAAATAILHAHGVSDADLQKQFTYTIADGGLLSQHPIPGRGTLVDEFLQRAAFGGLARSRTQTLPGGNTIDARQELKPFEERFNQGLLKDPWVRATARENLRKRQAPLTVPNIDAEAKQIADRYQVPIEPSEFSWDTLIDFIPVIGPLYDIEEGIRHQDATRAILGTLFLGLDALFIGFSG